MPNNKKEEQEQQDNIVKTAIVFAAANLGLLGVAQYFGLNPKQTAAVAVVINVAVAEELNERGKKERPAANLLNNAHNFFGADSARDLRNFAKNVVAGGSSVFNETRDVITPKGAGS